MDTSNPVKNPTPKSTFQSDTNRTARHRSMIHSPEFVIGADMAMLEYQSQLAQIDLQGNMTAAAAAHLRMLGAQEYLFCLRNLAEKPQPKMTPRVMDNLDHRS